ncbi:MAG: sulfocyanin-like copper-binding protein [Chloroflexota bacterium]
MHDETSPGLRPGSSLHLRRAAGLLATAVLVAACGGGGATANPTSGPSTPGSSGGITAIETEYKIDLGADRAAPGPVTFHITNSGTLLHEFVVLKTESMGDQLPIASGGGEIDEEAAGITVVDEVEDIAAGASADLDVTLEAGHYVVICNVAGHYQLGMHTDFTVAP